MLSTEIEYYQEIGNILKKKCKKKKNPKTFQNNAAIFKINSFDSSFLFLHV